MQKGEGPFITLPPHLRRLCGGSLRIPAPSPGYWPEIRTAITYPTLIGSERKHSCLISTDQSEGIYPQNKPAHLNVLGRGGNEKGGGGEGGGRRGRSWEVFFFLMMICTASLSPFLFSALFACRYVSAERAASKTHNLFMRASLKFLCTCAHKTEYIAQFPSVGLQEIYPSKLCTHFPFMEISLKPKM